MQPHIARATRKIVIGYAAGPYLRYVSPDRLPVLIKSIVSGLNAVAAPEAPEDLVPAVPISKSIHRDYLICLEDGERRMFLKRHLRFKFGLSPDEYRKKWGLPHTYPMVCQSYVERRSQLMLERYKE
jgi:predicted transcriptional regulator